ncbi:hypothetical protein E2C01_069980 [Portunus trituberculatus]|uniref:Uncharacterized protein n=1 Tax=Portunus trituberculatus TaxID=210409 RepID=A0A5B7HT12_PORTR|nr:hypothetical protein [Portunus trituberculatus]
MFLPWLRDMFRHVPMSGQTRIRRRRLHCQK